MVVGTDGSPTATRAVARAVAIAGITGAAVHLVSAHRPIEVQLGSTHQSGRDGDANDGAIVTTDVDVDLALSQAATMAAAAGVATHSYVIEGEPVAAILSVADDVHADLIIVGSVGMERRFLSSVPRGVAQRADCDVLIVHTG